MRSDWAGRYARDQVRDVSFVSYPTLSWSEFIVGRRVALNWDSRRRYAVGDVAHGPNLDIDYVCNTAHINSDPEDSSTYWDEAVEADFGLPTPVDYTPLVASLSHTSKQLSFSLAATSITFAGPRPGDIVVAVDNVSGQPLFAAQVESIDSREESRGSRTVTGTARTRDQGPLWRSNRWTTEAYPVGTELSYIVTDILKSLRLQPAEFFGVTPTGRWTPHTSTQFGNLTAIEMLSTLYFPLLAEPFVDAVGRFKPLSRDVRREADIVLEDADVLSLTGSKAGSPTTAVTVEWLDHVLSKSLQQDQALGTATITAGYFKLKQHARVYWSKDRKQRAQDTRMVVLTSANSDLIDFCEETYEQIDPFHGRITCETSDQVPVIIIAAITSALYGLGVGDIVLAFIAGYTVRVGSLISDVALLGLAVAMMQIGSGSYEVWGRPYDYVFAVNRTKVKVAHARPWELVEDAPLRSDLIFDEPHAQQVAVAETVYRNLAASASSAVVVEDPRIEPGDVLLLHGRQRFYVLDYNCDLTPGAPAVRRLSGFRV